MQLEYVPPQYEAFRTERPDFSFCRVALWEKGLYWLLSAAGTCQARVSGKFQRDAKSASDYPAVGDYVLADFNGDTTIIRRVLPRTSVFLRKAAGVAVSEQVVAANIDKVQENRYAQQGKPQEMKDKDTDNQKTVIRYFLADNDVSRLRLPFWKRRRAVIEGNIAIVQTDFNQNPYFCRTSSIAGLRSQVVRHSSARAAASFSPPCIWLNLFKRLA